MISYILLYILSLTVFPWGTLQSKLVSSRDTTYTFYNKLAVVWFGIIGLLEPTQPLLGKSGLETVLQTIARSVFLGNSQTDWPCRYWGAGEQCLWSTASDLAVDFRRTSWVLFQTLHARVSKGDKAVERVQSITGKMVKRIDIKRKWRLQIFFAWSFWRWVCQW